MQASSLAVAARLKEWVELNWKLKSSNEDLDLLNKRFDKAQGKSGLDCLISWFSSSSEVFEFIPKRGVLIITAAVVAEVENLKAELKKAMQ